MKRLMVVACMFLAASAPSYPSPPDGPGMLSQSYTQFGFEVLRELRLQQPNNNVFISPVSIAVTLAMTSNGASRTTREAILRALHLDGQTIETLNAANHAVIREITDVTAVQISLANALWVQQDASINPSFSSALESSYSAQVGKLDFHNAAAVKAINAWVAKHTQDRVQKIVDRVDPATVAMLTDAIAFKGKWSSPFDPKTTQPHDFKIDRGIVHQVPMMKRSGEYSYTNTNGLEAIRLPYADGAFAMYVVLPQDRSGMESFLKELTPDKFNLFLSSLEMRKGTIELPRFTMAYDTTLNGVLKKMGMGIAFSNNANFENIYKGHQRMQINEVRHASFLKVDEEGTEAAAATSVGIRNLAMPRKQPPPFHMVVDHPFFLVIRDDRSGQLLFTGTVFDPKN